MPKTNFSDAINKGITPSQRNSAAMALAYMDLRKGKTSEHGPMGATLCYFMRQLELDRIPYTLKAVPGLGYSLTTNPDIQPLTEVQAKELTRDDSSQQDGESGA